MDVYTKWPSDTRRELELIVGLTGQGMLIGAGAVLVALNLYQEAAWPPGLRMASAACCLGIGAALAWGKYPFEEGGDRLTVWAGRLYNYVMGGASSKRLVVAVPRSRRRRGGRDIHG
jgi:hypothetical protein